MEAEFFHADRRTEGRNYVQDEANSRFSQISEHTKNCSFLIEC